MAKEGVEEEPNQCITDFCETRRGGGGQEGKRCEECDGWFCHDCSMTLRHGDRNGPQVELRTGNSFHLFCPVCKEIFCFGGDAPECPACEERGEEYCWRVCMDCWTRKLSL